MDDFLKKSNTEVVSWEEFYPYVRPMAQDCPVGIVDAAIRAACIEFCQKSLIWDIETVCGDLIEGERIYRYNNKQDDISIVMPLCCIIRDKDDNGIIKDHIVVPANRKDLDYYEPQWRTYEKEYPERFYMLDSNTVCLVDIPTKSVANGLHILCAVKPNRKATGVAEFIFQDWAEEIASGALARIHAMAGRVWANPQLVDYHARKFRAAISRAKSKLYKSYIAQSKTMLPKMFASA